MYWKQRGFEALLEITKKPKTQEEELALFNELPDEEKRIIRNLLDDWLDKLKIKRVLCEECNKRKATVTDGSFNPELRFCTICWSNLNYNEFIEGTFRDIDELYLILKKKPVDVKKIKESIKEMERCYKILKKQREDIINKKSNPKIKVSKK